MMWFKILKLKIRAWNNLRRSLITLRCHRWPPRLVIHDQSKERPFWFQPFIQDPNGTVRILFSVKPILKHHVKIKSRRELNRREVEYQYSRNWLDMN